MARLLSQSPLPLLHLSVVVAVAAVAVAVAVDADADAAGDPGLRIPWSRRCRTRRPAAGVLPCRGSSRTSRPRAC